MYIVYAIILSLAAVVAEPDTEQPRIPHDITQYLPSIDEIEGWDTVGTQRVFVGEDLYSYINGGAVIYYEYGFNQVVTQRYADKDGRTINLEIYEMTSSASAYGVYTFKTRGDSQAIAVGSEALRGEYYVNFWKGKFVVTLAASDSTEETIDHMLNLAQIIDSRIGQSAARPSIVELMPRELAEPKSLVYVKGNTALANVNSLFDEDIFGVREGMVGDYGGLSIFIFKYSTVHKSSEWFQNAKEHLRNSNRMARVITGLDMVSFVTMEEKHITVKLSENYILVSVWEAAAVNPEAMLQLIEAKIQE